MADNLFQPPPRTPSLVERLQKLAGYTTDWNFVPTEYDGEIPCPICGHELEIHLHRGVSCPQCGSEFEMGQDGNLLPSDTTIDESAKLWPDTLPWSEGEQQYYRTAAVSAAGQTAYDSLISDGGFSLRPDGSPVPPAYYTSREGFERQVKIEDITPETISKYMHDHASDLQGDGFFGGWLSDGIVYLDVSSAFQTEEECMHFARQNHQIAIWDGINNVEILVTDKPAKTASSPDGWYGGV